MIETMSVSKTTIARALSARSQGFAVRSPELHDLIEEPIARKSTGTGEP
jgi:hypothetical protein